MFILLQLSLVKTLKIPHYVVGETWLLHEGSVIRLPDLHIL